MIKLAFYGIIIYIKFKEILYLIHTTKEKPSLIFLQVSYLSSLVAIYVRVGLIFESHRIGLIFHIKSGLDYKTEKILNILQDLHSLL